MAFERAAQTPVILAHDVGIAIRVTEQTVPMMHVGILFTPDEAGPRLLHLATDDDLKCEPFTDERYHWSDCAWLGTGSFFGAQDHLVSVMECAAKRTDVPYGFKTPRRLYDGDGGRLEIDRDEGVTCATFVARLFADAGFPIVDLGSWRPRQDDAAGCELVMRFLEARHADRFAIIKDQEMPYRLRPHEAATAAAAPAIPMAFGDAERLSRPLYDALIPAVPVARRLSDGTGALAS